MPINFGKRWNDILNVGVKGLSKLFPDLLFPTTMFRACVYVYRSSGILAATAVLALGHNDLAESHLTELQVSRITSSQQSAHLNCEALHSEEQHQQTTIPIHHSKNTIYRTT